MFLIFFYLCVKCDIRTGGMFWCDICSGCARYCTLHVKNKVKIQNISPEDQKMACRIFIPHRTHSTGFLCAFLYIVFCPDASSCQRGSQGYIMVLAFRYGQAYAIYGSCHNWCRRCQKIEDEEKNLRRKLRNNLVEPIIIPIFAAHL